MQRNLQRSTEYTPRILPVNFPGQDFFVPYPNASSCQEWHSRFRRNHLIDFHTGP